jgi:hypothetical protein
MKLTKRGQTFLGLAFIGGLLAMMGFAGYVETQEGPTCQDHQAAQDWERAWDQGCPFQDETGAYLYEWEALTR